MSTRYWKVLGASGASCHGGSYQWSLPTWDGEKWTPGEWTHCIDDIEACHKGWHVCTDTQLVEWLHETIWHVEIHPDAVITMLDDKCVTTGPVRLVAGTPWDAVTARLFAVECAARVLPLANDERCDEACEVAFRYALGDATTGELDSAQDSAQASAQASAWASAQAAQTADLLRWLEVTP